MNVVMKRSKTSKQTLSSSPRSKTPTGQPDVLQNRIETKAYELWDARGRRAGSALQDWLDAEQMIMSEARESHN